MSPGVRRRFYGRTRAEANAKLQEALTSVRDGTPAPIGRQTVEKYLADWLASADRSLRPSTSSTYERHIRLHVLPAIGRVPVAKLQPSHIDRLYSELLTKGLSRTTVQHVHSILRRALKQAMRRGVISRNPIELVDAPGRARPEMRTLSLEQVRAVLTAA
ncbi:MAG: tyrosine-type recombinase/integrase family protein, partial [Candidatus Dormibacteraeota bacterium]|nr:tyrosine-type recombinase/integrase family protein [Candidatus Dormibacteraeota bacterium]